MLQKSFRESGNGDNNEQRPDLIKELSNDFCLLKNDCLSDMVFGAGDFASSFK